jgi:hypothetical protein
LIESICSCLQSRQRAPVNKQFKILKTNNEGSLSFSSSLPQLEMHYD